MKLSQIFKRKRRTSKRCKVIDLRIHLNQQFPILSAQVSIRYASKFFTRKKTQYSKKKKKKNKNQTSLSSNNISVGYNFQNTVIYPLREIKNYFPHDHWISVHVISLYIGLLFKEMKLCDNLVNLQSECKEGSI